MHIVTTRGGTISAKHQIALGIVPASSADGIDKTLGKPVAGFESRRVFWEIPGSIFVDDFASTFKNKLLAVMIETCGYLLPEFNKATIDFIETI